MSEAQLEEFKEAFSLFDKKGNSTIASSDLPDLLRALGQNPTKAEVDAILKEVDPDGSKPVTFDAFLKVLQRPDGYKTQGSEEEFIQGFQVFDKDGTGFISIGELRYVLTSLGDKLSDAEVDELLKHVSTDKDGMVNYEEFVKFVLNN